MANDKQVKEISNFLEFSVGAVLVGRGGVEHGGGKCSCNYDDSDHVETFDAYGEQLAQRLNL